MKREQIDQFFDEVVRLQHHNQALHERLNVADEANDRMRDALDHIAKTCTQSRTQTLRVRWIRDRANLAVQGKPYVQADHNLPRDAGDSAARAEMKVRHLKQDKAQLQTKIIECRTLLSKMHQHGDTPLEWFSHEISRVLSILQE